MQPHPREIEARNRQLFVEIEPLLPTAHNPEVLAAAISCLARRERVKPDAAAFAVVESEGVCRLQQCDFGG